MAPADFAYPTAAGHRIPATGRDRRFACHRFVQCFESILSCWSRERVREAEPVSEMADAIKVRAIDVGADFALQVEHNHAPFRLPGGFENEGLDRVVGTAFQALISIAPHLHLMAGSV